MSTQLSARSDFTETFAIHLALKAALKAKKYEKNAAVKKAAARLCKELESEKSIYGRQLKMISLMAKGATIAELGRKLRCSRRTAFRYLNYLEEAGISVKLEGSKYHVDKGVTRMLRG
jgi:hypothetical protein